VTVKIDSTQHYEADPAAVQAMLLDPDFVVAKCLASGSIEADAEVLQEDGHTTLVSRRKLPAKLPGFAKKFVGETLVLVETQKWSEPDPLSRTATFIVDFGNNPISFQGDLALDPDGDGTRVHTRGDIKCTVPFVGGKIESIAREWIEKYLAKEQEVGTDWLAEADGA
jgi:hypothetical protein